jgi:hypothetical protein
MRAKRWSEGAYGPLSGVAGQLLASVVMTELLPGETILRTLMWINCYTQGDTPDPTYGVGLVNAMGVSMGNSGSVPDRTPLSEWTYSGEDNWMWRWMPVTQRVFTNDSLTPADFYRCELMNSSVLYESHAKSLNSTGDARYQWFSWELASGFFFDDALQSLTIAWAVLVEEAA